MIVVDTSAMLAILQWEPDSDRLIDVLHSEPRVAISAGTLAEAFIVAAARGIAARVESMVQGVEMEVVPVTGRTARLVRQAYERWGKGFHPAGLNYGDCFAYALAKDLDCPLLYIGKDFPQTDIASAL